MAPAVTKDVAAFKRTFLETGEIKASAIAAGYSANTAKMGIRSLPKPIVQFVEKRQRKLTKLEALGRSLDAERQESLMRGAIFDNIASGKDKACNSIKLGMQDKRVAMLTAESQTGVIVIQPPPGMLEAITARAMQLQAGVQVVSYEQVKEVGNHTEAGVEPPLPHGGSER
jgi:hypothetical protein